MKSKIEPAILKGAIRCAFKQLYSEDSMLFGAELEDIEIEQDLVKSSPDYGVRKLHEVCINHKLAEKLAHHILPLLENIGSFYVDIEFNRQGKNYKTLDANDGEEGKVVRPDIILHNRLSGDAKHNILVVECKKSGADTSNDIKKIQAFLSHSDYQYEFGLQVTYSESSVDGKLYFENSDGENCEQISSSDEELQDEDF